MNVGTLVDSAAKAWQGGDTVYVAQLSDSPKLLGMSTHLPTVSQMIQEIERNGWSLDRLTSGYAGKGDRPTVVAVFRRR